MKLARSLQSYHSAKATYIDLLEPTRGGRLKIYGVPLKFHNQVDYSIPVRRLYTTSLLTGGLPGRDDS